MNERKSAKVAGRPRDPEVDERILEATLQQLREQGYARMSLDRVAVAAGVGKPAIYRRWKGKADLATAALRRLQVSEPAVRAQSTFGAVAGRGREFPSVVAAALWNGAGGDCAGGGVAHTGTLGAVPGAVGGSTSEGFARDFGGGARSWGVSGGCGDRACCGDAGGGGVCAVFGGVEGVGGVC